MDFFENVGGFLTNEEIYLLESAELAADRAILALNTQYEINQLNLREAEVRCMMESGDMIDLVDYYTEAEDETKDKSEGLLKKAWDAILNLFKRIKDALFGKKVPEGDPNEKKKVDKKLWEDSERLCKVKEYISQNKFKSILGLVGTGAAVTGVVVVTRKQIEKRKDDVESSISVIGDVLEKAKNNIVGFFKKDKSLKEDDYNPITSGLNKIMNTLRLYLKKFLTFLGVVGDGEDAGEAETDGNAADDDKGVIQQKRINKQKVVSGKKKKDSQRKAIEKEGNPYAFGGKKYEYIMKWLNQHGKTNEARVLRAKWKNWEKTGDRASQEAYYNQKQWLNESTEEFVEFMNMFVESFEDLEFFMDVMDVYMESVDDFDLLDDSDLFAESTDIFDDDFDDSDLFAESTDISEIEDLLESI